MRFSLLRSSKTTASQAKARALSGFCPSVNVRALGPAPGDGLDETRGSAAGSGRAPADDRHRVRPRPDHLADIGLVVPPMATSGTEMRRPPAGAGRGRPLKPVLLPVGNMLPTATSSAPSATAWRPGADRRGAPRVVPGRRRRARRRRGDPPAPHGGRPPPPRGRGRRGRSGWSGPRRPTAGPEGSGQRQELRHGRVLSRAAPGAPPSSTASRSCGRGRPRATSRSRITYSGDGSGTDTATAFARGGAG